MTPRPLRVLHCPDMVGGHLLLARAERELGIDSWSVAFQENPVCYASDEVLWSGTGSRLLFEGKRWQLLGRALLQFDVIHYNFGRSLLPQPTFAAPGASQGWKGRLKNLAARLLELRDLPLLKRAGKTIVMTFQGDDARQGDVLQQRVPWDLDRELEPGYYSFASDAHKRRRIATIARHADLIYALNPDLLQVLPAHAKFLPYAHVDMREWTPVPCNRTGPPLVLHAPTHRGIKGTRFVVEAAARLQAEGVPFRFELVEGLPQEQARECFGRADLLVDQLLVGWYGGLAVELMALGKPVIAYVHEPDLVRIPRAMRDQLPVIQATPDTIYAVLKEWLTVRRHELVEQGIKSRAYVEQWHDRTTIASWVVRDYEAAVRRSQAA